MDKETETRDPAVGSNACYFEDLSVGDRWTTPARTITESDIVMFAAMTWDHNPIHTNAEYAKDTQFGERILHGPAGFAIATGLESRLGIKDGTAVAFLGMTWDYKKAVSMGDTIKVIQEVARKRETRNPEAGIVFFNVWLVNQNNETVQEGEWKVMFVRKLQ